MSRACRHCRSPARGNPCWSRRFGAVEKECVREDREAREARAERMARDAIAAQTRHLEEWNAAAARERGLLCERGARAAEARIRKRRRLEFWREVFYYATAFALMGWTIWVIAVTHP